MKKIGIIIVNYKDYAREFLSECRDSLREQSYPGDLVKVYIVDNAGTKETMGYLKENYPEACLILRSDGNYAAANNAGMKKALEDGCEYLIIVNMDVKLDREWLSSLAGALDANPEAGIAQSKILLYPKKAGEEPKLNSLGNISHFLGFGFTSGYNEPDREIALWPEIKGYASGCSLIIRKEALIKIGGYNEEYYMYHDDVELSHKARLAGLEIILAPESRLYHKYEFSRSVRMLYYMERNRYLFMFSFYKLPTLLILSPAIIAMDLGMLLYSIPGGWLNTKLKIYGYFLKPGSWNKIFKERKNLRSLRTIKDRELTENFSGRVIFQEIDNPVLKYIANPVMHAYWGLARKMILW